jgi:hypothetical protein
MDKNDIIKQIVDDFAPIEYPELYSREQMEDAVRKALEYNKN